MINCNINIFAISVFYTDRANQLIVEDTKPHLYKRNCVSFLLLSLIFWIAIIFNLHLIRSHTIWTNKQNISKLIRGNNTITITTTTTISVFSSAVSISHGFPSTPNKTSLFPTTAKKKECRSGHSNTTVSTNNSNRKR